MTEIEIHLCNLVEKYSNVVRRTFPSLDFQTPYLEFFVHPTCAGRAYMGKHTISLNTAMAQENKDDFYFTVVHELAHLVTARLYPYAKQAHGPEFKRVDRLLGGRGTSRHNYNNLETIKASGTKRFHYNCKCSTPHFLSTIRHNKSQRGAAIYTCTKCDTAISFSHQV